MAERAEEISEERADGSEEAGRRNFKRKRLDKAEMATAAAALEKSLIRLKVVRRRTGRR